MPETLRNWAGNVTFSPRELREPTTLDELRSVVAAAPRARALGTRHSFNDLADTEGTLVSVGRLPETVEIDAEQRVAWVSAGMRYGDVAVRLHAAGFAIANLGSLPHISVAGACATGTHGSGASNRNLPSAVRALEMVTADGDVVRLDRDADPQFPGAVVALGRLGVVTGLALEIVPTFDIRQFVYLDVPGEQVRERLGEIMSRAYSVSLFTDWRDDRINQVWLKHKADDAVEVPSDWLGARLAAEACNPVPGMPAANCTDQLGAAGPWHERLPHFRLDFTPSSGEELQTEYLVDARRGSEAIEALRAISTRIAKVLQISEIRAIAADDLWLSPAYGRDSIALHFTWIKDSDAVLPVVHAIEERLAPFDARPHWGKVFTLDPSIVRSRYERHADFEDLISRFDRNGKFSNRFVDALFPRR